MATFGPAPDAVANPSINGSASNTQIEQQLAGPGIAITSGSLSVNAGSGQQYGTFTGGDFSATPGPVIGIDAGIFLSTGFDTSVAGPNDQDGVTDTTGTTFSDPELTGIDPAATNDPVIMTLQATPSRSFLKISFVFGSDEYPEYVCSQFNDAFGFFIKPTTSSTWTNIALVPDTNTPIAVNTVNNGSQGGFADGTACDLSNGAIHVENGDGSTPANNTNLQFDGFTVPLTSEIPVTPGTTYDVKLAIADAIDDAWDSAVFVKWISSSDFANNVDLELSLSADDTTPNGADPVTFSLNVTNTGQDPASNVAVSFALPEGFSYLSDNSGGSYDPNTGIWTVPTTLAASTGSATLEINTAAPLAGGSHEAFAEVASVDADDIDSTPGNGAQSPAEDDEGTVSLTVAGPTPFVCDNTLYQIATSNSQLRRITFSGTSASFVDVGPGAGEQVNAGWGHNEPDGLIYGVRSGQQNLWAVDGNGVFYDLGIVSGMGGRTGSNAGDVLPDGRMVFKTGSGQLTVIDLTTIPYAVSGTISLSGPAAGANYIDFAYNAIDGLIYSVDRNTNQLFWIDPDTGATQYFGPTAYGGAYGAQWVDEDGRFYMYDNATNELFLVDIGTNGNGSGAATLLAVSTNDEGGINDGAFCRGPAPVPLGAITGTVYGDTDGSDALDGSETGLGAGIAVRLYDERGTPGDPSDDVVVSTADTIADGTYNFDGVLAGETYRIEVDEADPELPAGASIGTTNPLIGVSVSDGQTVANQNFGFDVAADLSLAKTVDDATPATGDTVTFTLTVTNGSPGPVSGVAVSDSLPAGLDFVSATGEGSYDAAAGLWTVGTVAGNGTAAIDIAATVRPTGNLTNRAEITASDLPDPDSDPNAGFDTDDLGDGIADDDEAEVTLTRADLSVSGTVFEDNGAGGGTAHDGAPDGGEAGLGGIEVRAVDVLNGTVYATATTAGDGDYTLTLPATAAGRQVRIETTALTDFRAISEAPGALPGLANPDTTDGAFVFTPAAATAYTAVDFGQVRNPTLIQDRAVTSVAGGVVVLAHTYTSHTAADVSFAATSVVQSPSSAFTAPTLFADTNCNGAVDSGEGVLSGAVAATAGMTVCVLARVQASAGAPEGAELSFELKADTAFSATPVTHALSNTDRVTVAGQASLAIAKQVRNVSTGGSFGTANQAAPGEVLEYRITFRNDGAEPVFNINVFDQTPAFTTLDATLPAITTTPAGMSCAVVTPIGGGGSGYSGSLQWRCTGSMSAGDAGEVRFSVRLDP